MRSRRGIRLAGISLSAGFMMLAMSLTANATMCPGIGESGTPAGTRRLLEMYPVVLVGRVVSIEPVFAPTPTPSPRPTPGPAPPAGEQGVLIAYDIGRLFPEYSRVTFEIRRRFQGATGAERLTVRTEPRPPFDVDAEYLVFAGDNGQGLEVGPCSPSAPVERAADLIASLAEETRAGRAP